MKSAPFAANAMRHLRTLLLVLGILAPALSTSRTLSAQYPPPAWFCCSQAVKCYLNAPMLPGYACACPTPWGPSTGWSCY